MIAKRNLGIGLVAGGMSLAAAFYVGAQQLQYDRTLATSGAPVLPVAADLLPPGSPAQPKRPPLTAAQRERVEKALWREPLDQKLGNLIYIDKMQSGMSDEQTARQAALLSRLGWRYTPAQQNLLMRAALDQRFGEVVDRADGLLRRQRLTPVAVAMLGAMETIPQVRNLVIDKLRAQPMWRTGYLAAINPETPPAIIAARAETLRTLLRDRQGVRRDEIVPLIGTMIATGKAPKAYALWQAYTGKGTHPNLLADSNFENAATLNAASEDPVPFEWTFRQGLGYAAVPSSEGVTISWDGRGSPLLLAQMVPLQGGKRYVLRVRGTSDAGTIQRALAPTIVCGATTVRFDLVEGAEAQYRSEAVPANCAIGVLSIVGNLDSGRRNVDLMVTRMELVPV